MGMEFESEQAREDFEQWLADIAADAERIQVVQDELSKQPEFAALVRMASVSGTERNVQLVADYAVLFVSERLGRKIGN